MESKVNIKVTINDDSQKGKIRTVFELDGGLAHSGSIDLPRFISEVERALDTVTNLRVFLAEEK